MKQKEITINGKQYPVIFTLATLSNFEEITGKPFFKADLDIIKNRIAIIRGYNARHHAGWEQARLVAYNAHYCMGAKNTPPVVSEWIKFLWEKDIETSDGGNMPSASDIEEMRRIMLEENARLETKKE